MAEELLVRVYNVGFGDFIFIRIPDDEKKFYMLIDCGTKQAAKPILEDAFDDLVSMLPDDEETLGTDHPKKRLDLLVVTHPHADHIKGFDPDWFKDIAVGQIWMSSFMKVDHPQAKEAHSLEQLAERAAISLQNRSLPLSPGLRGLLQNSICNKNALKALRDSEPAGEVIDPACPRIYICRDIRKELKTPERAQYNMEYANGTTCFTGFVEKTTRIRVLAPEWDIDQWYLGKNANGSALTSLSGLHDALYGSDEVVFTEESPAPPVNISGRDFRTLRNRLRYSALAFSQKDDELKNNTSVVLLLEWRGKRLLFTGDAEWEDKPVEKGRHNSCWAVLLKKDKNKGHLAQPVNFLKVSHHGSVNGTPFVDEEGEEQPFLDAIVPEGGEARIVVSTLAGEYKKKNEVPYPPLMEELGRRCAKTQTFVPETAEVGASHPLRTDLLADTIDELIEGD
jgi:beta-lactamase superfamily II metal-dependent hydrolase